MEVSEAKVRAEPDSFGEFVDRFVVFTFFRPHATVSEESHSVSWSEALGFGIIGQSFVGFANASPSGCPVGESRYILGIEADCLAVVGDRLSQLTLEVPTATS